MDRRTGFTREEMFWVVAFGCGLGSGAAGVMGLGMEVAEMGGVVFWLAFSSFIWMFSKVLLYVEVAVGQYFRKVTTSSNSGHNINLLTIHEQTQRNGLHSNNMDSVLDMYIHAMG